MKDIHINQKKKSLLLLQMATLLLSKTIKSFHAVAIIAHYNMIHKDINLVFLQIFIFPMTDILVLYLFPVDCLIKVRRRERRLHEPLVRDRHTFKMDKNVCLQQGKTSA